MLIKGSLSNSINAEISFASDFGKQHNIELLCDWPQCAKAWQNYPLCDEYPHDSYRESVPTMLENGLTCTGVVEVDRNCADMPVTKDMCASSTPKVDGYVYKRRKLRRNIVALLSEENAEESDSCHFAPLTVQKDDLQGASPFTIDIKDSADRGIPSTSGQHHLQKAVVPSLQITNSGISESVQEPLPDKGGWVIALPAEVSTRDRCKSTTKKYSNINNSCSSSKSYIRHGSSSASGVETVKDCAESRELCGSFLKRHGLLDGVGTPISNPPSDILDIIYTNLTQLCKACGHMENPLKMLICDLCEEAFHMSCCNPKVKKPPVDIWYCQPCFRKKRKVLLQKGSGDACNVSSDMDKKPYGKVIILMLRDNTPYRSGVRVGKDFQAEIPEWAGPTISDGSDYFDEPSEMDIAESASLLDLNATKPSEASFIGNWIQCREVIYDNPEDKGTVCGKWRRAPLFVVQTDDWDCSCALLWDTIHADCAVPQEVETDVVLEHLKCIQMLRPRVANKQRSQSSKK